MQRYELYIKYHHDFIKMCEDLYQAIENNAYFDQGIEILKENNYQQYKDVLLENYDTSYANPAYSVEKFEEKGQVMAAFAYDCRNLLTLAYEQDKKEFEELVDLCRFFLSALNKDATLEQIIQVFKQYQKVLVKNRINKQIKQNHSTKYHNYTNIVLSAKKEDLRYLYRYGVYVDENIIEYANILKNKSEEEIKELAHHMVDAYYRGFKVRNKPITTRKVSRLMQIAGLELMGKEIIEYCRDKTHDAFVANLVMKDNLKHLSRDHINDEMLYLDEAMNEYKLACYKEALEIYKDDLALYLGNIIMVMFGAKTDFSLPAKNACELSAEQLNLNKEFTIKSREAYLNYVPSKEISYTGMALPCFEIGDNYEEIFNAVCEINLLDPKLYSEIQEVLIDTLDQGVSYKIVGQNGNETNITLSLQPIKDASKESIWMNCGADVNVPIGEVYTSPKLEGTNGLIHVKEVMVNDTLIKELKLYVKDGMVNEYSCANGNDEKEGKELLKNLFFKYHDSLPLGELALGTNTKGYVISKELGIINQLHTLLVEKMGPHIAIGDTCFARQEDQEFKSIYTDKVCIAKDNECSIKRLENPNEAYFNTHTDITIPYDEVALISITTKDNTEIAIVENGKFVLKGTEVLNEAFK